MTNLIVPPAPEGRVASVMLRNLSHGHADRAEVTPCCLS